MEGRTESLMTPSALLSLELDFQQAGQLDATHPPIHGPMPGGGAAEDAIEHYVTAASNFPGDSSEGRLGAPSSGTHTPAMDLSWNSNTCLPTAPPPSTQGAAAGAGTLQVLHTGRNQQQQQRCTGVEPLWHPGGTSECPGDPLPLDKHMGSFSMGLPTPCGSRRPITTSAAGAGAGDSPWGANRAVGHDSAPLGRTNQGQGPSKHAASVATAATQAANSSCSLAAWVPAGGSGSVPLATSQQQLPQVRALSLPEQPARSHPASSSSSMWQGRVLQPQPAPRPPGPSCSWPPACTSPPGVAGVSRLALDPPHAASGMPWEAAGIEAVPWETSRDDDEDKDGQQEADVVEEGPDQVQLSTFEQEQLCYAYTQRKRPLLRRSHYHQDSSPIQGPSLAQRLQQQQQQKQHRQQKQQHQEKQQQQQQVWSVGQGAPFYAGRAATAPPLAPPAAAADDDDVRPAPAWPLPPHCLGSSLASAGSPAWQATTSQISRQGHAESAPLPCGAPSSRPPTAGGGEAGAGEQRVRVLLSCGGSFERRGAARTWMYVGGDTRLVRLARSASLGQLMEQVLAAAPAAGPGGQQEQALHPTLKYALPGGEAPLFVALDAAADVATMWEEWEEGAGATPGAPGKLQLFLEVQHQQPGQQQQELPQQQVEPHLQQQQQQQQAAAAGGGTAVGLEPGTALAAAAAAAAMATAILAPCGPATPTSSSSTSRGSGCSGGADGVPQLLPAASSSSSSSSGSGAGVQLAGGHACNQLSPFAASPFQQAAAGALGQGSLGAGGASNGWQPQQQEVQQQQQQQQQQQGSQVQANLGPAACAVPLLPQLPSPFCMAAAHVDGGGTSAGSRSSGSGSNSSKHSSGGGTMRAAAADITQGVVKVGAAGGSPEVSRTSDTASQPQVVAAGCSSSRSATSSLGQTGAGADTGGRGVRHSMEVREARGSEPLEASHQDASRMAHACAVDQGAVAAAACDAPAPGSPAAAAAAAAAPAAPGAASAVVAAGGAGCSAVQRIAGPAVGKAGDMGCGVAKGSPARGEAPLGEVRHQLRAAVQQLCDRLEVIQPWELQVVRFLGAGAFGEVFLSRWHGTEVAVKCLSPGLLAAARSTTAGHAPTPTRALPAHSSCSSDAQVEPPMSSSFGSSRAEGGGLEVESSADPSTAVAAAAGVAGLLREASILAGLRHPNVVAVYGVVLPPQDILGTSSACNVVGHPQEDDLAAASSDALRHAASTPLRPPALVTEYLAGGSLHAALSRGAEWLLGAPLAKVKVLLDTARGLDYLHAKHLVHFDLKSANLLLGWRDRVPVAKVADFGLSKQKHSTYVSGINTLRGTLPWMAPEVLTSPNTLTEAADIYSFGVIMWELWTGAEPWDGLPIHALLHRLTSPQGLTLPVPGEASWREGGDHTPAVAGQGQPAAPATETEGPPEPAPGYKALMLHCWGPPEQRPTSGQLLVALEGMMGDLRRQQQQQRQQQEGGLQQQRQ